jgi:hypothetical protein
MKTYLKTLATLALLPGMAAGYAQTTAGSTSQAATARKRPTAKVPPKPSVQSQIEQLRQQIQTQNELLQQLQQQNAEREQQLQQAQQAAAAAQAAATQAQQQAAQQSQAVTENTQAVSNLQGAVTDLKTNNTSLATTVQTVQGDQANIRKAISNPDAINFKGITLSPTGSFLAGETVWRSAATGGDINTSFTGIPLQNSEAGHISEFFGSGRQSRIALKAVGKVNTFTMSGYYEADFLSAGASSNNNQSNSYTLRQRQAWADAKMNSGWDFSAGQGWSLATETTQGLTRGTEILPSTIDPQYEAGFVWERQESFRVSKDFGKAFYLGFSAENPQTLNPGGNNLPLNVLIGSGGTSGGLYNAAAAATTGAALANYSFNYAPDLIAKAAIEPGWGHWEVFGIQRTFRDRIYPSLTCTSTGTPAITTCTGSTSGAYNDKEIGGGIGGGFRGPLVTKKITVGLKGLWGQGMGRYGSSTIADVTIRPNGQLSPIHGFSALSTIELNPTARLNIYLNYGGDYLDRDYVVNAAGTQVGYGNRSAAMSSCNVEPNPGNGGVNQSAAPTGAGGSCAGNNKDVQEFTAGYWYDFYRGPAGRLRQGIQYSYIVRNLWSGNGGTANVTNSAEGTDNMVFTSFRYYLP